jgi:hypothetical protein
MCSVDRLNTVLRIALPLAIALWCGAVWGQGNCAGVLVLQDGGVLAGQVARDGENYVVTRAGGQIRVAASRVLFECGSLEEAYDRRRQQNTRPTAEAHLALADWCLRYDLIAAARRELTDAQALDAQHPRLALLERRLANAEREPRETAPTSAQAPDRRDEPAGSLVVASVAGVPAEVVERFTRKVQPVLVNNCSASGCHSSGGANAFQLDRALLHGLANRRSTMHNLAATLALVDRDQPQLSPLLAVPRRAHGGMDDPVFGPRQEPAFRHLVEWVTLVAAAKSEAQPAASVAKLEGSSTSGEVAVTEATVVPVNYEALAADPMPDAQPLRFGAQLRRWQPRDPFDPEIFNRRHRPEQGTASSGEPIPQQGDR